MDSQKDNGNTQEPPGLVLDGGSVREPDDSQSGVSDGGSVRELGDSLSDVPDDGSLDELGDSPSNEPDNVSNPDQEITSHDKHLLIGLIVIVALLMVAAVFLWKYFAQISTEEGRQLLVEQIRGHGFWGVFILLGLQMVQIVVAVVPGEVVEVIGGMIYGPWLGTLIIIIGAGLASAIIFALVRKLGYPFVSKVVSQKNLDRFSWLSNSRKRGWLVFFLFLIPGLPKDVLSYIVPLTDMRMRHYLIVSLLGRAPGCLVLAFGGASFLEGNYKLLIILIAAAIVIVAICLLLREPIFQFFKKHFSHRGEVEKDEADAE